jgi:Flp pilus assembly pilin Flp
MTEYIIIVALIAVSAIGVFRLFGDTLRHQMAGLSQELSGKTGSTETTAAQTSAAAATSDASTKKDLSNYSANNQHN